MRKLGFQTSRAANYTRTTATTPIHWLSNWAYFLATSLKYLLPKSLLATLNKYFLATAPKGAYSWKGKAITASTWAARVMPYKDGDVTASKLWLLGLWQLYSVWERLLHQAISIAAGSLRQDRTHLQEQPKAVILSRALRLGTGHRPFPKLVWGRDLLAQHLRQAHRASLASSPVTSSLKLH